MKNTGPGSARPRIAAFILLMTVALIAALAQTAAQAPAKKAMTVDDYTKWRSIAGQAISGDGKWVAYTLQLTNTIPAEAKPVLHLLNLETGAEVKVEDATGGVFSADSKWIAYQVDPGAAQRARAARSGSGTTPPGGTAPAPATPPAAPPAPPAQPAVAPAAPAQPTPAGRSGSAAAIPPRRLELRNLETGEVRSWQEIGTFAFSADSAYLFLRRRAPEAGGGEGGRGGGAPSAPGGGAQAAGRGTTAAASGPRGLDVILLDLGTGRHQLLGSVGDIAFNRTGELLAYTVDAAVKDGNGVFVFDTRGGRIVPLDNDAKVFGQLAWSESGNAVAVLKGSEVEKMREKENVLLAFRDVGAVVKGGAPAPAVLDPAKAESFPKGWVISDRAGLAWSEDDVRVFFGAKEQVPAPETSRKTTDETPDVDVWNTGDERIQSEQMVRADRERNVTFRQAFDAAAGRFVKLADETMRDLEIAPDGKWAVGMDTRGYIHDHKRPAADFYRVNTSTGERTLIAKAQLTGGHAFGISPHGSHFLYWKDGKYQAYELETGRARTLGAAGRTSFVNTEYDHPGPKPPYGPAGYSSDGKAVIAHHKYDLWLLPLDGAAPVNLTQGLGDGKEVRFRIVRTVPDDPAAPRWQGPRGTIDLAKPVALSAYGEWTKRAGLYELADGKMKEIVFEDATFSVPVRAMNADRYVFTRQTFVEFPDLRVSGPDFKDSRKISDANPQQKEYLWGRRLLFDYKNGDGVRLQGILAIPDDYKRGEKRPMIVTFYEKNSQGLHRYSAPSYLTGMGGSPIQAVSDGYLTMLPDVHFRTGSSHSDMLECVEAATRKVIEMGYADPKRIAVTGHSYGGEGAAYIGVMSKMFAAVGMGAGVTDLYNDFSQNWGWGYHYSGGSGANGNDYYLYGQGRWGFSPWDQPDRYRDESALTHAPKAKAPFLIMHGTSDPTVNFYNALGFYNALRYNGKKAVLLAYPNEGHGLRGVANRRDLTVRYFEFFDHYLKGAPAPKWLTEGVPFLKKEADRQAAK
jgi:dipeptidyl aminopeptidase/acylaminoacyl peptidase